LRRVQRCNGSDRHTESAVIRAEGVLNAPLGSPRTRNPEGLDEVKEVQLPEERHSYNDSL
jgi:hypothetical protein